VHIHQHAQLGCWRRSDCFLHLAALLLLLTRLLCGLMRQGLMVLLLVLARVKVPRQRV
jgi:hypothetical protein